MKTERSEFHEIKLANNDKIAKSRSEPAVKNVAQNDDYSLQNKINISSSV